MGKMSGIGGATKFARKAGGLLAKKIRQEIRQASLATQGGLTEDKMRELLDEAGKSTIAALLKDHTDHKKSLLSKSVGNVAFSTAQPRTAGRTEGRCAGDQVICHVTGDCRGTLLNQTQTLARRRSRRRARLLWQDIHHSRVHRHHHPSREGGALRKVAAVLEDGHLRYGRSKRQCAGPSACPVDRLDLPEPASAH